MANWRLLKLSTSQEQRKGIAWIWWVGNRVEILRLQSIHHYQYQILNGNHSGTTPKKTIRLHKAWPNWPPIIHDVCNNDKDQGKRILDKANRFSQLGRIINDHITMGEFPASERTMIRQKAKVPPILNAVKLKIAEQFQDSDKIDRWVHAENLGSILSLVYFDSWSWQSFVSTCDFFNCPFPLDVQNEIQLLSEVFCYSWLVCLLGFWLRNTSLVKVGNPISDGIVFVFILLNA